MSDQNKTEKATPRGGKKGREQGQVVRSRDLVAGLATMAAVMVLAWQLPAFASEWRRMLEREVDNAAMHPEQAVPAWRNDMAVFRGVALAASLSWILAMIGPLAPGGLGFAAAPLSPAPRRLSPPSHLKQ